MPAEAHAHAGLWPWEAVKPHDVAELLRGMDAPWWLTGGWGVDLFIGRQTRNHLDVDIALLRRDQHELRRHLHGWDIHYATPDRVLEPWDGSLVELPIRRLWVRRDKGAPWTFEVLLEETREERWAYRNLSSVSRPIAELAWVGSDDIPILTPEVSLLYMLSPTCPKMKASFLAALPSLEPAMREWLADALERAHPGHPATLLLRDASLRP